MADVVAAEVVAGTQPGDERVLHQGQLVTRLGDPERLALPGQNRWAAPEQLRLDPGMRPVTGGDHVRVFGGAVGEADPHPTGSLLDTGDLTAEPQVDSGLDRGIVQDVDEQFPADRDHRMPVVLFESQREPGDDLPVGVSHLPGP